MQMQKLPESEFLNSKADADGQRRQLLVSLVKQGYRKDDREPSVFPESKQKDLDLLLMGAGYEVSESYAVIHDMVRYEQMRQKGTLGETIAKNLEYFGVPKETALAYLEGKDMVLSFPAYDFAVLTMVIGRYCRYQHLGAPPKALQDIFGKFVKEKGDGGLVENFPKLAVDFLESLPKAVIEGFGKYSQLIMDLPQLIGVLKDPGASWYEMKFAVFSGMEMNGEIVK